MKYESMRENKSDSTLKIDGRADRLKTEIAVGSFFNIIRER